MERQGHTPVPRYRAYAGPAILAQGFRPFFLLAGIWAPAVLPLFIAMVQGQTALPTAFDAVSWHYHEMLFGFVAAAMAGFLLTAIPNWTGRLPLQGTGLLGLVVLWLAGRVAVAVSGQIGVWPAALIDLTFLSALAAVTLREIVAGHNWRNLPIVAAVALFLLSNALSHAEAIGLVEAGGAARRCAIAVVIMLISLVGGRIVPSFTQNWLAKRDTAKLPAAYGRFDHATLAVALVALAVWALEPEGGVTIALVGLAAVLHLFRWARWRGYATFPEPLLWVLHLAYLWIPVGLGLLALSPLWPAMPPTAAIHALTAGAMGTMTLAVMSRAILGHTGRALHAGPTLTAAYLCITLAAVFRVLSPFWIELNWPMLFVAAGLWFAAFLLYLALCGPMLALRRAGRT
jgi:uncharacterized protein involved in response to NO